MEVIRTGPWDPHDGNFYPQETSPGQGTLHFKVDEEGNVDFLPLPKLVSSNSDSDLSSEDETGFVSEEGVSLRKDVELSIPPLEPKCYEIPQSSSTTSSHTLKDWIFDIMGSLGCADSMCTGQSSFTALCVPDTINRRRYKHDCFNITSINEKKADSSQTSYLSEAYSKGIYYFMSNEKRKGSTSSDEFVYISKEEKHYASRWNGHLPLVPMSASVDAIQRKSKLRKRALVTRGQLQPDTSTQLID